MKTLSVSLFFMLICLFSSVAQDIISLSSGDELKGKILRLNPKDIVFIPQGINDTITMWRSDVVQLRYQNGTIINLADEKKNKENIGTAYDSIYYAGVADAKKYYKGYKAAGTGTLVSALAFPFNLIPAIACSATVPNEQNLGYPDTKLMQNPAYNNGYKNQAHKIKQNKVWKNYALGCGAVFVFYMVVNALIITTIVY
jgi:hypothetical protein